MIAIQRKHKKLQSRPYVDIVLIWFKSSTDCCSSAITRCRVYSFEPSSMVCCTQNFLTSTSFVRFRKISASRQATNTCEQINVVYMYCANNGRRSADTCTSWYEQTGAAVKGYSLLWSVVDRTWLRELEGTKICLLWDLRHSFYWPCTETDAVQSISSTAVDKSLSICFLLELKRQ